MIQRKTFAISIGIGILLLAISPFIWRYNRQTLMDRLDFGTVAYQMRSDLVLASLICGAVFLLAGCIGYRSTRAVKGWLVTSQHASAALPVYGFGGAFGFQAIPALCFCTEIYSTKGNPIPVVPISHDSYFWLRIILLCVGGFSVFCSVFLH